MSLFQMNNPEPKRLNNCLMCGADGQSLTTQRKTIVIENTRCDWLKRYCNNCDTCWTEQTIQDRKIDYDKRHDKFLKKWKEAEKKFNAEKALKQNSIDFSQPIINQAPYDFRAFEDALERREKTKLDTAKPKKLNISDKEHRFHSLVLNSSIIFLCLVYVFVAYEAASYYLATR